MRSILIHRIDRLEHALEIRSGPTREEAEPAQERIRWRSWLWAAHLVEAAGVTIPPHCLPNIAEAQTALAGESDDQKTKDNETVSAYAKGHGYAESPDTQEFFQRLLTIAQRSQPGVMPESMAEALALALYGQEEVDDGKS